MFEDSPLNKAIRTVKENSYLMHKALDSNNMKEALKYSDTMLAELRADSFTPRDYYALFFIIFDELSKLQKSLVAEPKVKKLNLYDTVQYSKKLIPRLYLLVTVGSVYIDNRYKDTFDVIWDTFGMLKGVQHPCRGLFLRYYFIKTLKERIENREKELPLDELISLFTQNLREMNSLWIRLNSLIEDKETRRSQRKELAVIVGDNIMQLASLEGVTLDVYKEKILPKLLEIILENNDKISQEFLFECLLSAFAGSFHVDTLQTLLDATEKLNKRVNLNNIYLKLMERFSDYAESQDMEEGEEKRDLSQLTFIYDYFKTALNNIINKNKYPLHSLLRLVAGFASFTVQFYDKRLDYVDEILKMSKDLCDRFPKEDMESSKCVESLVNILTAPLTKLGLQVLKIPQFPPLMHLLPMEQRKDVSIGICKTITTNSIYLVNEKAVLSLTRFLEPLFSVLDAKEDELDLLGRVLHFVETAKYSENLKMIQLFESNFDRNDRHHLKVLYPQVIYRIIHYLQRNTNIMELNLSGADIIERFGNMHKAVYLEATDSPAFDPASDFSVDLGATINYLYTLIKEIEVEHPLLSLQLWLDFLVVVDAYAGVGDYDELIYNCFTKVMTIFENDIGESRLRASYFYKIIGYVGNMRALSHELYEHICLHLKASVGLILTRAEQAKAVLALSPLFVALGNDKVKQCVQRSWELVRMSLKYEKNGLLVLVSILDVIIGYIDKGTVDFNAEEASTCLQMIEKHCEELSKEDDDETKSQVEDINRYKTRVTRYWRQYAVNSSITDLLTIK